jgi:uncharacterized protein
MNKENVIKTLRENRELLNRFHVRSLSVFGSVVRGESMEDSDIDLIVEFDPGAHTGLFAMARLQRSLKELLGRDIDLVTPHALHKALKKNIMEEAVHAI